MYNLQRPEVASKEDARKVLAQSLQEAALNVGKVLLHCIASKSAFLAILYSVKRVLLTMYSVKKCLLGNI